MIGKVFIYLIMLQLLIGGNSNYGDKQIIKMLEEYFISTKKAPSLIGHQFYENSNELVFQIEVETDAKMVNEVLVFSFDAINKLANLSKKNFTHSILVIHFYGDILPIVAESNMDCARRFFIDGLENEDQWRKNCLSIKNY